MYPGSVEEGEGNCLWGESQERWCLFQLGVEAGSGVAMENQGKDIQSWEGEDVTQCKANWIAKSWECTKWNLFHDTMLISKDFCRILKKGLAEDDNHGCSESNVITQFFAQSPSVVRCLRQSAGAIQVPSFLHHMQPARLYWTTWILGCFMPPSFWTCTFACCYTMFANPLANSSFPSAFLSSLAKGRHAGLYLHGRRNLSFPASFSFSLL